MTEIGGMPRPRRSLFRLLAIGLAAAVAGTLVVVRTRDEGGLHDKSAGPLYTDDITRNSIPVAIGETFTFGQTVVGNKTGKTAELEAVRVRPGLPDGLEIVEVLVVGPNRRTPTVASQQAWPPTRLAGHLRPLKGAKVPPESTPAGRSGTEIVFGLKVTKPGIFGFAQFDLDYRIGSTKYTVRIEDGVVACAPYADFPDGCGLGHFEELDRQVG